MLRRTWIAVTGVALLSGPASHADNGASTIVGVNPRLSEGAYALEFGNYDEGVRLTLEGLRSSVRPRDRVGALSNLCAGYVGLQDYQAALRYCNRALRIDEKNWHAYNNRSLAYLGLGNTAAAQRDLEKVARKVGTKNGGRPPPRRASRGWNLFSSNRSSSSSMT